MSELRDASSLFSSPMCLSCETADGVLSEPLAETFLVLMLGSFLRSPVHSLLNECGSRLEKCGIMLGIGLDFT